MRSSGGEMMSFTDRELVEILLAKLTNADLVDILMGVIRELLKAKKGVKV